jgi:hypothetical protein
VMIPTRQAIMVQPAVARNKVRSMGQLSWCRTAGAPQEICVIKFRRRSVQIKGRRK